ncbi:MAG: diphthamide biosynthesis enzyme Dph2, partial [Candidatus Hydrothermarchaeota archaeon]
MREVLDIIKDKGYKKIALQFPEGLKEKAIELAETIESKTNTLVFISSDPCY